jgi:hypothetical protein
MSAVGTGGQRHPKWTECLALPGNLSVGNFSTVLSPRPPQSLLRMLELPSLMMFFSLSFTFVWCIPDKLFQNWKSGCIDHSLWGICTWGRKATFFGGCCSLVGFEVLGSEAKTWAHTLRKCSTTEPVLHSLSSRPALSVVRSRS